VVDRRTRERFTNPGNVRGDDVVASPRSPHKQ
jgi:hypothetical protein